LLSDEIKEAEQNSFNTLNRIDKDGKYVKKSNVVNDTMSGIRISDSSPLDVSCLVLCQKVDENTAGDPKKLPMLRECLKPGTVVEFDLTIDTTLCSFDKDDIIKAINSFTQNNVQYFDNAFKSNGILPQNALLLGGGAGYQTKTVTYSLLGKSTQSIAHISKIIEATLNKNSKQGGRTDHKHSKDRRLGVSPHIIKRTYYLNKKYTMGVCTIEIKEIL